MNRNVINSYQMGNSKSLMKVLILNIMQIIKLFLALKKTKMMIKKIKTLRAHNLL